MNELKPCPFCGSKKAYPIQGLTKMFLIHCNKCGATVSFLYKEEKKDVIEAYNKRAEDEAKRKTENCVYSISR